jgi:hypothetical protein
MLPDCGAPAGVPDDLTMDGDGTAAELLLADRNETLGCDFVIAG